MQFKKRWRDHFLAPLIFTEENDLFLINFSIINRVPYKIEYHQFHLILVILAVQTKTFYQTSVKKYCSFTKYSMGGRKLFSYGFSHSYP